MGQIIYREYIVFRGSNISCSLSCYNPCRQLLVSFELTAMAFSLPVATVAGPLIMSGTTVLGGHLLPCYVHQLKPYGPLQSVLSEKGRVAYNRFIRLHLY